MIERLREQFVGEPTHQIRSDCYQEQIPGEVIIHIGVGLGILTLFAPLF